MKEREYLSSLRSYLTAITGVFVLSLVAGVVISINSPHIAKNYLEMFEKSFGWIKTLNPFVVMMIIFLNNALKSLIAIITGVALGFIPLIFVAGNGMLIGMLVNIILKEKGSIFVITALLPHGVIEIPMVLISASIGLRLGHGMYLSIKGENNNIKSELKQGLEFYMKWVAPLLLLAAIIETFVTPLIVFRFTSLSLLLMSQ